MTLLKTRTDPSTSSRFTLILLAGSLALVLLLGWQAHTAGITHLRVAREVVRDYAALAGIEFSRRAVVRVGYNGYYRLSNAVRASKDSWPAAFDEAAFTELGGNDRTPDARVLVRYGFRFDTGSDKLSTGQSDAGAVTDAERRSLIDSLKDLATAGGNPDTPFELVHTILEESQRSYLVIRDGADYDGIAVNMTALGSWFGAVPADGPLLPVTLAEGKVTNVMVNIRVQDEAGNDVFVQGYPGDPYLTVARPFGDEYSGVLRGFTVSTSLEPEAAGALVIGGLPRSRLPAVLALLVLTVGMLIAAIRQLRRERQILRLRSDFVSRVSHELRTPLTHIRMFAETLLYERARDDAERRKSLEIINREARRLGRLVDNVLQFSGQRRGAVQLDIRDRELASLTRDLVREFDESLAGGHIELTVDEDAHAPVDANAYRQILINLLDNAVKYGPADQVIHVALATHGTAVRLIVEDEGPGIPDAEKKRIWDGYYRLSGAREGAVTGTGIGLSVVNELAALHGGSALVEDGADSGSRFVVEFPLPAGNETAKQTATVSSAQ